MSEIPSLPPKITKYELHAEANSKKGKIIYWTKTVVMLLFSSFLVAVASYCFITPNEFTIGGVSGIAILLNVASNGFIPQWIVLFGLNLPLVITAFFVVKRKFAVLSAANIGMQTVWLALLENVFPTLQVEFTSSGEKIFAAVAAGLCIGVGIALALKTGGSTGGADILAVIIQRKIGASSISWMLFAINCIIIGFSVFVFPGETLALTLLPIMMSAFESYIESKTIDSVTNGFQSAIEFRIITDKPEEMSHALMLELGRGVTSLPATGMYTKEERAMLFCVISKRQIMALRRIMKSIDPDSFAVMSTVSQVLGLGFYTAENG